MPSKSKPMLPSFASIRDRNVPPSRRSTGLSAVAHPLLDSLLRDHASVDAFEIEAHAAVLRFHPRPERAAFAQVDGALGGVPAFVSGIPLLDVLGVVPDGPDLVQLGVDERLDGDLHGYLLGSL